MNGALIINKDKWKTSFTIVNELRRITNIKRIGHMGTLDPLATGVLPILIGNATKAQVFIQDHDKEYIATMKFGMKTDTLDITGNVIFTNNIKIDEPSFIKVLDKFKGRIKQKPPMFSAIKKNGQKLYELARRGEFIDLEERDIEIFNIDIINFDYLNQTASIKVACSKGTYIRSLCSDIGNELNSCATLTDLIRTKACGFKIEDSYTIEEFKEIYNNSHDAFKNCIIKIEDLFDYPRISVSERQSVRFKNGGGLSIDRINVDQALKDEDIFSVYDNNNKEFLGLGKISLSKDELSVLKIFV